MLSIRDILSTTILLALLSPVLAHPPVQLAKDQEAESDVESFQKLLDQVDPPSLHAALHDFSPKKFKHGMFQEDRNAVKAIHMSEPKAAHSIIELAKRQDQGISNSTTPASSAAQASTSTPISTSAHIASPVPPISEGSTLGSVLPVQTSSSVEATSSGAASSQAASTSSPASSAPASSASSAPVSSVSATTSAPASSLTNGEVVTTTDASGHIIVSTIGGGVQTITPSSSSSSSVALSSITSTAIRTSTLPDGSQSTITAITVIQAGNSQAPTPTGEAGASSSKTGSVPGLQTGEAVMSRGFGREGMAVLVGALGFAAMM